MTLSRRALLLSSAALTAGAAVGDAYANTAKEAANTKPNIIFILADDLGYADVSCYGRRDYKTPAVDRLAAEGMRFTQAYANSAVCSATRAGLITGRYQNRIAIGLEEPLVNRDVGLPPEHPTLPSLLRTAGYKTVLLGKWHLGQLPKYGPLQSGYDHFWGFRGGALDYFAHGEGPRGLWDDDTAINQTGYLTDLLGDRAVATVEAFAAARQPFFLSLHFNAPHWPWEGPTDEAESRRLAASASPYAISHFDGGSAKTYAAMVTRMDMQIGRLLECLDRLALTNNTIVVFTSDNGGERFSDTWPFSGKKTELLEGGLRIPAIIRWPGVVAPASVSDQVMMSMDWLPTLVRAAGGATDPRFPSDGVDLAPALSGGPPADRTLCWRYLNLSQEACRSGDWKYLKILDNTFLFNLAVDPMERANLKTREPERFAALTALYRAWDATMLPTDAASFTAGFTGPQLADHYGVNSERTVVPLP